MIQDLQDDQITPRSNPEILVRLWVFRLPGRIGICQDLAGGPDLAADMGAVSGIVIRERAVMNEVFKMNDPSVEVGAGLDSAVQHGNAHTGSEDSSGVGVICMNGSIWL